MVGYIYKIASELGDECYIGSTWQSLSQRMAVHRHDYKRWKNGRYNFVSSFAMFEKYGVENCKILLVRKIDSDDKQELRASEHECIMQCDCVNRRGTIPTDKKAYNAARYVKHREQIKTKTAAYRAEHSSSVNCPCGSTIKQYSVMRHNKSKKHLDWIAEQASKVTDQ